MYLTQKSLYLFTLHTIGLILALDGGESKAGGPIIFDVNCMVLKEFGLKGDPPSRLFLP